MEQEVKVTIHRTEPTDPVEEPQVNTTIPDQLKELSETISETLSCFRESESYEWLQKSTEKVRMYIRNNPEQSILVSLGTGLLFGLFIKKRR